MKQKKTVTFKNILETSDDVNIVKKEPNFHQTPPVPIIKKESLTRGSGESIVLPSRLTGIVKSASFKSTTFASQSKRTASFKDHDDDDDDEDEDAEENDDEEEDDDGECDEEEERLNGEDVLDDTDTAAATDKRFASLKRNVHSSRVIKPNKKFIDGEDPLTSGKDSKKNGSRKRSSKGNEGKDDKGGRTESFINNQLSSKINSSKLDEMEESAEEKGKYF